MTRFTTAANQTAAALPHVWLATLVHIDLSSGHLYLTDAPGSIVWDTQTWLGVGGMGSISAVEESTDDRPKALKMTLTGVDSDLTAAALTEDYYGRAVTMYSAWFDSDGALAGDPEEEWSGRIDTMTINIGEASSDIELVAENRLILWNKTNGSRWTDEDQQNLFPGDLAFSLMAEQMDQVVLWGKFRGTAVHGHGQWRFIYEFEQPLNPNSWDPT